MKKVILLGSTGSVGRQTLEVISEANTRADGPIADRETFEVVGLSANENEKLLKQQAREFGVKKIVLSHGKSEPLVNLVTQTEADLVVVAVSGPAGVEPTLAAIRSGKNVALANKEALVMEGELIMEEVKKHGVKLIPLDSEHNAIFQLLAFLDAHAPPGRGGREQIKKIILPCSGGPFFGKTRDELAKVTPAEALRHPVWSMGPKITIDSATLVNKGFEVIEAHHLFNMPYDRIDVVIHPECRVHGMIELEDGTTLVHAAPPDMKIPIRHALGITLPAMPAAPIPNTFYPPDHATFPGIHLGYAAGRRGHDACQEFVLANAAAVSDFLAGKIGFLDIYERVSKSLAMPSSKASS